MEAEKLLGLFKTLTQDIVIEIVVVITSAVLIVWLSQRVLPWLANHLYGRQRLLLLALIPTTRILIFLLALAWVVPLVIETTMQNMIAILGAAGVAIGFAMKDYVSSMIAGIVAVYELPYRPGDWIEVDGQYGEVTHIGMRTVEIVTANGDFVFVPHLKIWDHLIVNANRGKPSLLCVIDFYLATDHDPYLVQQVLYDVALTSPYLQLSEPIAVVVAEQPWGTHYQLKANPIDPRQQFLFKSDVTARGKTCLRALSVPFANLPPDCVVEVSP